MTFLGATCYHLGCLAAPSAAGDNIYNNEKVIRKKNTGNCQSITTSGLILHKQNSRTSLEKRFLKRRSKTYTLCVLLTANIQVKEVLLVFDEDIGCLMFYASSAENDGSAMGLERTAIIER